jgi:hypothetical protein
MPNNNFDAIVIVSGITGGMVAGGKLFLSGCNNTEGPNIFFQKKPVKKTLCTKIW